MSAQLPPIPPPPVAYQYDPRPHALWVNGELPQLFAALDHLQTRTPKDLPIPGRYRVLAVAGVLFAVAVALRLVASIAADGFDPAVAVFGSVVGGLLTVVSIVVGIVGLVRSSKTVDTVIDPAVPRRASLVPEAVQLLRAVFPGLYDTTVFFYDAGIGKTPKTGVPAEFVESLDFGVELRSVAGWSSSVFTRYHVTVSGSMRDGKRYTNTTSWHVHAYTARPTQLSADIFARVDAAGQRSFPQVPFARVTEVGVKDGTVRVMVQSRDAFGPAQHAAYANAVARLAGLPGPVFAG